MSKKLIILQLNDSHGYLESHNEFYWGGEKEKYKEAGGFSRISNYFKKVRNGNPDSVIALDNGDTIHGTYAAVKSKGNDLVPVLNRLDFDGFTAHWEFAYGPRHLLSLEKDLDYPLLACNCYFEEDDDLVFEPYRIVNRNGLKVGVIGIAATIVDKTMPEHFGKGIYLTLGRDELSKHVENLREEENVDLVVVVSHLGYPQELKMVEQVDGVDVFLSGHSHDRIYEPTERNNTIIIQSGCHGSFIGRLDLSIDNGIENYDHTLVSIDNSISPDPKVKKMVEEIKKPYREYLDQIIGYTEIGLNRYRVMESTMDNLLLESLMDKTGADVAFSNGWRYGAPVKPGPIKIEDLWNIIPTNPPVSVCKISGEEIWDMMEENLEHTFSRNPYKQMGGYVKRCLGLNIYFKIENPEGKRIEEFFIENNRLKKDKIYNAVFVTTQGIPEKYGYERKNLNESAIKTLRKYIEKKEKVNPKLRGTIVPI